MAQYVQISCPGRYCGLVLDELTNSHQCDACPRGQRVNYTSQFCEPCDKEPSSYEWLYLGFMVLTVLYFHIETLIFLTLSKSSEASGTNNIKGTVMWLCVAIGETLMAAAITLLISDPIGSPTLYGCGVKSFLDWYSVFQDPSERFIDTLYCHSEVIYPLYSIVFVFLGLCFVVMMSVRSWFHPTTFTTASLYSALYFLPGIALIHTTLCGVIYYSFPYLCVTGSLILTAILLAETIDNYQSILMNCKKLEFLGQILMHWVLHGYGILAIVTFNDLSYFYILLTPLPTVFYIATLPFSEEACRKDEQPPEQPFRLGPDDPRSNASQEAHADWS